MSTPPRLPISRSHIHRAEDIYAPGEGDQPNLASVVGAAQTVTLLGPFEVAYDTEGLVDPFDNGAVVADIPQGAVVIKAWAVTTTGWSINDTVLDLLVGKPDGYATAVWSADLQLEVQDLSGSILQEAATQFSAVSKAPSTIAVSSGVKLMAQVLTESVAPTSGSCDVYALIATPST